MVRDLRVHRAPTTADELADFETDVLAGFVLARASAGFRDSTIRSRYSTVAEHLLSDELEQPVEH